MQGLSTEQEGRRHCLAVAEFLQHTCEATRGLGLW